MINSENQHSTNYVAATFSEGNELSDLWAAVIEEFDSLPEDRQSSFSLRFRGQSVRVRENKMNGLTVIKGRTR
jgi:hypothetical protein